MTVERLERKAFRAAKVSGRGVTIEADGQRWSAQVMVLDPNAFTREERVWRETEDEVSMKSASNPYGEGHNPHKVEPLFTQLIVDKRHNELWHLAKALGLVEGLRYSEVNNLELVGSVLLNMELGRKRRADQMLEDFVEMELHRMETEEL